MSNVNSAKHVIETELDHAKQGAAYYQARAAMLEEVLDAIERADSMTPQGVKVGTRARAASRRTSVEKRGGKPIQSTGGDLPSTGKGFWPSLITSTPQSAAEILDAAIKVLKITPSEEQLKKLMQRETNALHTLVKSGEIQDSGSGRSRRFFRNA